MTNIKNIFDIQIILRHPKKPSILYPITEVLSNLGKGNTVTGIAHWRHTPTRRRNILMVLIPTQFTCSEWLLKMPWDIHAQARSLIQL